MYGASGDAHLRSEVSGACRGLSFVLEALWHSGRVYIYRHLRAELLQLARVVTRYVAVRGPGFVSGNLEWFRVTPLGDSDLETLRRRGRFFVV